jgi:hypothetical protein
MEAQMKASWHDRATSLARGLALAMILAAAPAAAAVAPAHAFGGALPAGHDLLRPGNLLVSASVYEDDPTLVAGSTQLPPGCTTACVTARAGGGYPEVFNNALVDETFGVTSKIFLDQLTRWGAPMGSLQVPNSAEPGVRSADDQMVTSFSSKSELSLNLSTRGSYATFMGYLAPVDALDVSNANTPGVVDPTNPDPGAAYRVVGQVDSRGRFHFTETNAFSGDNGRAAILNEQAGANLIYAAGNAGNGSQPIPAGIIAGTGAQLLHPSLEPESLQGPGFPTPLGSFNITQLGDKPDKASKDTNFRGVTIFDNVVYYTKGSGGNGVDTVYFVDTTGTACPNGVGLPVPGAALPSSPLAYTEEGLQEESLMPTNMCILEGFPTALKSKTSRPFGLWFANSHTLYVADEGNGKNAYSTATRQYTEAAAQADAGLQKWVFDSTAGEWKLAYVLQSGLELGQPYTVPRYPRGNNSATELPWSPATDGLRDITGTLGADGKATIWGITSTVSGSGDQGADPNKLVAIADPVGASSPGAWERFYTLRTARSREVLRGVSSTPGTSTEGACGPFAHDASHCHGHGRP